MAREFKNLVMTNIRRIAHTPREAECIARFLIMQVILVCVAHAAQKTWYAGRMAGGDPEVDVMPADASTTITVGIRACNEDPEGIPDIPRPALWEYISGPGQQLYSRPAGTVFPADTGQHTAAWYDR